VEDGVFPRKGWSDPAVKKAVALIACLAAGSFAVSTAEGVMSDVHSCGNKGKYTAYEIKANFSCQKGVKVVKGWWRGVHDDGEPDRNVKGFRCNHTELGFESAKVRCKKNVKVVKWVIDQR
jgi:predicted small secreted protein